MSYGAYPQQQYQPQPQPVALAPEPPLPAAPLAPWEKRVLATLIDAVPFATWLIVGYGFLTFALLSENTNLLIAASVVFIAPIVPLSVWSWWQVVWVQGRTGQTWGKRKVGIRVISAEHHQPIGKLNCFLRALCHYVDGLAYVGYLWPLWDQRRQTFADKIMKTVVVTA